MPKPPATSPSRFVMHHGVPTPSRPRPRPRPNLRFKTWRNPFLDTDENDESDDVSDIPHRATTTYRAYADRRETNYNDRGRRQFRSSYDHTREQPDRNRSRSPKRSESPLFFPEAPLFDIGKSPAPVHRKRRQAASRRDSPKPAAELPIEHPECTCPISYECVHRGVDKLDCRPLVVEWKKITDRMDEESYTRQVSNAVNPAGRQITAHALGQIFNHLQLIETLPLGQVDDRKAAFQGLKRWILQVEDSDVSANDLHTTQILPRLQTFLDPSNAQMRQNRGVSDWIEEELTYIYRKLNKGDLLCNPNRGLRPVQILDINGTVTRTTYRLDKSWPFYTDARYFGAGELVNGQLWFSREQLMRDGAHAPIQAGISGTSKSGAYSVVMGLHTKENKYADVDMHNIIEYEGTALPSGSEPPEPTNDQDAAQDTRNFDTGLKPTSNTQALMKSLESGRPVRVIRSFRAAPIVSNKPVKGYRYDGLYKVTRKTAQKEDRQIWSFRMERLPNQGRLRPLKDNEPFRPSVGHRKGWRR